MLTHAFLQIAQLGAEWVLWVLVALSVLSLTLILDRWLFFRRTRVPAEELSRQLTDALKNANLDGARDLLQQVTAIEGVVLREGLQVIQRGSQACSEAMLSAKARERVALDRGLALLGTIGSNAPFVGLLGTVLGIIKAAQDLSAQAGGNPQAVMSGVFEALVATAVGLFVAIPAVVAFNHFQKQVRLRMAQVDSLAHLMLIYAPNPLSRLTEPPRH